MSELDKIYIEVCCGNADALEFLRKWNTVAHGVDDIVDAVNNQKHTKA